MRCSCRLALWALAVAQIFASSPSWGLENPSCSRVIFSAHPEYPPYQWAEGEILRGASAEITTTILNELGIKAENRSVGSWQSVLQAAREGSIDLVLALKRVPEREEYLAFTETPFATNPMAVFMLRERAVPLEDWELLAGKIGSVTLGDRYGDAFDRFAAARLTLVPSADLASNFRILLAGNADYVVTGLYPGRAYLARAGLAERIVPLTPPLNQGEIHHGFSRRSPCQSLIPAFNRKLQEMTENGQIAAALERGLQQWAARSGGKAATR